MAYAVRAWRDKTGQNGVTIGTVTAVGMDNVVAEFDLDNGQVDRFVEEVLEARARARDARVPVTEPMPGPYDAWVG